MSVPLHMFSTVLLPLNIRYVTCTVVTVRHFCNYMNAWFSLSIVLVLINAASLDVDILDKNIYKYIYFSRFDLITAKTYSSAQ